MTSSQPFARLTCIFGSGPSPANSKARRGPGNGTRKRKRPTASRKAKAPMQEDHHRPLKLYRWQHGTFPSSSRESAAWTGALDLCENNAHVSTPGVHPRPLVCRWHSATIGGSGRLDAGRTEPPVALFDDDVGDIESGMKSADSSLKSLSWYADGVASRGKDAGLEARIIYSKGSEEIESRETAIRMDSLEIETYSGDFLW